MSDCSEDGNPFDCEAARENSRRESQLREECRMERDRRRQGFAPGVEFCPICDGTLCHGMCINCG